MKYSYTYEEYGITVTIDCPIGQAPASITFDRDFSAQEVTTTVSNESKYQAGGWPMVCEPLGVRKSELAERMKRDERAGIRTDYTASGAPILRDRGHRREYFKMRGVFDKDAGYGDHSV